MNLKQWLESEGMLSAGMDETFAGTLWRASRENMTIRELEVALGTLYLRLSSTPESITLPHPQLNRSLREMLKAQKDLMQLESKLPLVGFIAGLMTGSLIVYSSGWTL